ncbi:MAG: Xaa-Pro peptidase family protein [Clostridium sp.]|nr:Xaa-Pro peptidase family protein [Clostridium sp.]
MAKQELMLLEQSELEKRLERVRRAMEAAGADFVVVSDFPNLYYLTGRVFRGWAVVGREGEPRLFVHRPTVLTGGEHIRKPEEIISHTDRLSGSVGLETGTLSWNRIERMKKALDIDNPIDASAIMDTARSVKTEAEIELIRRSGIKQMHVYHMIPKLYREGMSDVELQIAIEHLSRTEGCLGIFRVSGDSMEIYMGNVLTGKNADSPSPYDFAMGGAGVNPSLPVGADGSIIERGNAVMVDMNGNYTGYMTDMTRCYSLGTLPELAMKAHECSRRICRAFEEKARPGVAAKDLYEMAVAIAGEEGLDHLFMGHAQQAGFIGHGVGIVINELPVIAPRSQALLEAGNVVALEPKFVIPGVGAVGVENTYVIREDRVECLTAMPEEIVDLA